MLTIRRDVLMNKKLAAQIKYQPQPVAANRDRLITVILKQFTAKE